MACKITASYVDYDYFFSHFKGKALATPIPKVVYTEYRDSISDAEVAVFTFLRKLHRDMIGATTPDGEHILTSCKIEDARFILEKTYFPKDSYTNHTCSRYIVSFDEVDAVPDGTELKEGEFCFNPVYADMTPARPTETITDWEVERAQRFPFKPTWDLFRVRLVTPTGPETASIDFDNQHGTFQPREVQPYKVNLTPDLLNRVMQALSKVK